MSVQLRPKRHSVPESGSCTRHAASGTPNLYITPRISLTFVAFLTDPNKNALAVGASARHGDEGGRYAQGTAGVGEVQAFAGCIPHGVCLPPRGGGRQSVRGIAPPLLLRPRPRPPRRR